MKPGWRGVGRLFWVACLLAGIGPAGGDIHARPAGSGTGRYEPDPKPSSEATLSGETWSIETPQYAARLRALDGAQRREFLRARAVSEADPFAPAPGFPEGFLTFVLEIENRGKGSLVFQPQGCRLTARGKEIRYPLDWPTIQTTYDMLGKEVPPGCKAARDAMYDGEVVLAAGGRVAKLLVYPVPDPRTRAFNVEIVFMQPSGEPGGFTAYFRRARGREER